MFETTSPYHHIRVLDRGGIRMLCFDDAMETQMSLQEPLQGHFEYTEYFHMPWLWNTQITSVLMIGLGGGSTQRLYEHYYSNVNITSIEIDPVVVDIAKAYFRFQESPRQKVQVEDGRVFLRRNRATYDVILLDAYVQGRYGSSIPQHLATREFFELARGRLTTNGILAYNVIGTVGGWHADIVGAIYRTLNAVFPQVYLYTASSSQNVVLLATKAKGRAGLPALRQRANLMIDSGQIRLPGFKARLERLHAQPPGSVARSPVLTDDFAPVEGLSATFRGETPATNAPATAPPRR